MDMKQLEKLEELSKLKEKGILTEEEFLQLKNKLLNNNLGTHQKDKTISTWFFGVLLLCLVPVIVLVGKNKEKQNEMPLDAYCAQFLYGQYPERYDWSGGTIVVSENDIKAQKTTKECLGIFSEGKRITIKFPSKEVMQKWAEFDKQFIHINGTIQKDFNGNYYIYNPRFIRYN